MVSQRKKSQRLAQKRKNEDATDDASKKSNKHGKRVAARSRNEKKKESRHENESTVVEDAVVVVVSDDDDEKQQNEKVDANSDEKSKISSSSNNNNNNGETQTAQHNGETNQQVDVSKGGEDIACPVVPESTISDFIKEQKEKVVDQQPMQDSEEEVEDDSTLAGILRGAYKSLGYHDKPYYTKLGESSSNDDQPAGFSGAVEAEQRTMIQAHSSNMRHPPHDPNTPCYNPPRPPMMSAFVPAPAPVAAAPVARPHQIHPSYLPRPGLPPHFMQHRLPAAHPYYFSPQMTRAAGPYAPQYYPHFRQSIPQNGVATSHHHHAYQPHPYATYQPRAMGMPMPHRFVPYPQPHAPEVRKTFTGNAAV